MREKTVLRAIGAENKSCAEWELALPAKGRKVRIAIRLIAKDNIIQANHPCKTEFRVFGVAQCESLLRFPRAHAAGGGG
jgi:hypothetical protein